MDQPRRHKDTEGSHRRSPIADRAIEGSVSQCLCGGSSLCPLDLSVSIVTFQSLILQLSEFWASRGCALQQPLDVEVGAGTTHPETFLRVLGPAHWNVAYVQPSRRPADGRFGENPNRLFKHHQFQDRKSTRLNSSHV